jgi:mono/diheme cytochrome c family protein
MIQSSNGMQYSKVFLGILIFMILFTTGVFAYLRFGTVPVAVSDTSFPFEKQIVRIVVRARIARQTQIPPFAASEAVFESGASTYQRQCSICHGIPGRDASLSKQMFPAPPQLWKKHGAKGVVGVSDDDPGFSYWIVSNGIRLSGMPSFSHTLSDRERWEVSLLLKNADKKMSPEVTRILGSRELY